MAIEKAKWDSETLGEVMGTSTGEEDRDSVPGGWEGTDDATSTAPSDLTPETRDSEEAEEDPDAELGRAYGGGLAKNSGGIADLMGAPVEESRDWEHNPVTAKK